VHDLAEEEHRLRQAVTGGAVTDEERARLADLETTLDQCWDLLRRRRAARDTGSDPDTVTPRPVAEVESYLQ
jgi:hypothetical protein